MLHYCWCLPSIPLSFNFVTILLREPKIFGFPEAPAKSSEKLRRTAGWHLSRLELGRYMIVFGRLNFVLNQRKHSWQILSLLSVLRRSKNFTSNVVIWMPPSVPFDHYLGDSDNQKNWTEFIFHFSMHSVISRLLPALSTLICSKQTCRPIETLGKEHRDGIV